MNVQFGDDLALVVAAPGGSDVDDAVDHQHLAIGEAGGAFAEQTSVGAGEQLFAGEVMLAAAAGSGRFVPIARGLRGRHEVSEAEARLHSTRPQGTPHLLASDIDAADGSR
ncbi:MAG: hypothetical protein AMXMBFR26_12580 [Porticoccaceae bacterium]